MLWIQGLPFEKHAVASFWSLSFCPGLALCPYLHHNNQLTASPTILHLYLSRKAQVPHTSGYQKAACGITRGSEDSTCEQAACKTVWFKSAIHTQVVE